MRMMVALSGGVDSAVVAARSVDAGHDVTDRGFKVFLSFLRLFRPRYHLHGHVHIYRQDEVRETRFEETTVVNVYPYKVLEI